MGKDRKPTKQAINPIFMTSYQLPSLALTATAFTTFASLTPLSVTTYCIGMAPKLLLYNDYMIFLNNEIFPNQLKLDSFLFLLSFELLVPALAILFYVFQLYTISLTLILMSQTLDLAYSMRNMTNDDYNESLTLQVINSFG